MINIIRYSVKSRLLKPWIKFFWYLETASGSNLRENSNINSESGKYNKLLPVNSRDIIINISGSLKYRIGDVVFDTNKVHINGIRDKYGYILQTGEIKAFGVSFYSFGLYPFLKISPIELNNMVVNIRDINKIISKNLEEIIRPDLSPAENIQFLEKYLEKIISFTSDDMAKIKILRDFEKEMRNSSISSFCVKNGINIKSFERMSLKYSGSAPKTIQNTAKFQTACNSLIHKYGYSDHADLACDNGYYDQAHFIKEFKRFSGVTPSYFLKEKMSVKENSMYSYR